MCKRRRRMAKVESRRAPAARGVVYRKDTQRNTGGTLKIHGGQSTEVDTRRHGAERKGVACTEDIQKREERGSCRTEDRGREAAKDRSRRKRHGGQTWR